MTHTGGAAAFRQQCCATAPQARPHACRRCERLRRGAAGHPHEVSLPFKLIFFVLVDG
jgi:hypothetical protein